MQRGAAGIREGEAAGWQKPVVNPGEAILSGSLSGSDTYAYRHRIGDLMAANPVVASPKTTIHDAAKLMMEKAISSLLVAEERVPGQSIEAYAIVTERDVMRQIACSGAKALKNKIGDIAVKPLKPHPGKRICLSRYVADAPVENTPSCCR